VLCWIRYTGGDRMASRAQSAVMASEFEQLAELEGFLKTLRVLPWMPLH
jgi:hypothetical protein